MLSLPVPEGRSCTLAVVQAATSRTPYTAPGTWRTHCHFQRSELGSSQDGVSPERWVLHFHSRWCRFHFALQANASLEIPHQKNVNTVRTCNSICLRNRLYHPQKGWIWDRWYKNRRGVSKMDWELEVVGHSNIFGSVFIFKSPYWLVPEKICIEGREKENEFDKGLHGQRTYENSGRASVKKTVEIQSWNVGDKNIPEVWTCKMQSQVNRRSEESRIG